MSAFAWLFEKFEGFGDREAFLKGSTRLTYRELLGEITAAQEKIQSQGIWPGQSVILVGDLTAQTWAYFLALSDQGNIVVPLLPQSLEKNPEFADIAQSDWIIRCEASGDADFQPTPRLEKPHALFETLRQEGAPGLILFSSGSTGKSKAAVHNLLRLVEKFKTPRKCLRTLTFLLLDHIGGINTLLYVASNGGAVVSVDQRTPAAVCEALERHHVELLPVSPTFLNLLLMSGELEHRDLSALKLITYGTETMPESTLKRVHALFPQVQLQQTYGLSELGILRSKSKSSDSLWMKVGGEDYQTKVVEGVLWIKARSAMLGYLNAPNPFDAEGWFCTKDRVEVDGDYLRVLGRDEEIINVGGEKVYPAEVESALLTLPGVRDAIVYGETHPLMGNIVVATLNLAEKMEPAQIKSRVRRELAGVLAPYKIPQKLRIVEDSVFNERFKRMRLQGARA